MAKSKPVPPKKQDTRPAKQPSTFDFTRFIHWSHLVIITLLFWTMYSTIFEHKPDLNGDNFAYYLLGKRLANGLGYTNATSVELSPHIHFPPGYPALLCLFMKTVGDDQDTLNFMNGLMLYGALLILYFLVRRLTASAAMAFVVSFITALNSHLLRSATITMSEIPFLLMTTGAIYLMVRAIEDTRQVRSPYLYLAVALIAAAYYTKTTAVALLAGTLVYLAVAQDWKRLAVVTGGFILIALPWYIRGRGLNNSYASQLMQVNPYKPELGNLTTATFLERIQHNLSRYLSTDIPAGVLCLDTSFEKAPLSFWLLGIGIIALVLWGIYRLRDYRLLLLGYIGGTLTILMIWPDIWGGIRFIVPLVPIAIFLALFGIKELAALAIGEGTTKYLPYSFLLLGFLYAKPINALEEQAGQPMPQNYVNYFELAKWAKKNTPKDAIFSARKPDMFVYYSDRLCIPDKPSLDDKEVLEFFRKNRVDYVVIEQLGFSSTAKYLVPAVQKNQDKFEVVLQLPNPDTYLLKFKR